MKKMVFFCFLSIVILILMFHQTIFIFLATGYLQTYFISKWGQPLEYERVDLIDNQLVILYPQFKYESSFTAKQMIVDFHFNWSTGHFDSNITIEEPHIHLQPSLSSRSENWEKLFKQEEKWIKTQPSFHIKTGLLTWSSGNSSSYPHRFYFDIDINNQKRGVIKLYLDPQDLTKDYLLLQAMNAIHQDVEVNCSCHKINCAPFMALAQLLGADFSSWFMTSGCLQGELKALFPRTKRPYLEGELIIEGLAFHHIDAGLIGHIEQSRLKLEKPQVADRLLHQIPTFTGQFDILKSASLTYHSPIQHWTLNQIEGTIQFNSIATIGIDLKAQGEIQFDKLTLPLKEIQAHLLIQQHQVKHSLITFQLAGLKGKMDVEWSKHQQLLNFTFEGIAKDIIELFPPILQEGLRQQCYSHPLWIIGNLKRQNQQFELDGTVHIQQSIHDQTDVIHFGYELKKMTPGPMAKFIPLGWFYVQHFPLGTFLSPFIFGNKDLRVSGAVDCEGSFDDQLLMLNYAIENLKIENEELSIAFPSSVSNQLIGSHQIDFRNGSHQGSLPFQQATYMEKKSGLVFQDIQGVVTFKDQTIHFLPIETYCEGVYFAGVIEWDYRHPQPGTFKLSIHCPTLFGKVSHIQRLLAHLKPASLLHKIPLEGEVSARGEGLKLDVVFTPQECEWQVDIRAILTDGFLPFEEADMALKAIDMDIDYQHQILNFSAIQGTLLVGKPRLVEEYFFTGHHIRLDSALEQPNIELDIAIKDQEHELLRLVGYTRAEEQGIQSLHLDQNLSHLSCIYPQIWQCRFKNWSSVEQFELHSQFDLGCFLRDLKRFQNRNKFAQFLSIEGLGSLTISYHADQSYTYQLEGSHIKLGNSDEHYAVLKGNKQDKKWMIDQLQWDDWQAYAEVQQTADNWKIPFLGLNKGQSVLLGLEGSLIPSEGLLQGQLNFCEIDLEKLENSAPWHSWMKNLFFKHYPLKNFEVQITEKDLFFSAFSQQDSSLFQIIGQMEWPSCRYGQCTLGQADGTQASPLCVQWENHPQRGWMIHSLQGAFAGCSFLLEEENKENNALKGKVSIDVKQLCPLLTPQMAEVIQQFKIGSVYSLDGCFWQHTEKKDPFLGRISFKGSLVSEEAIVKGYQLKNLQADVRYIPGHLEVQNLLIQDPAGSLKVAHLKATLEQSNHQWNVFIPHLVIKNLRPYLLRDVEWDAHSKKELSSLLIKSLDIQNFSGELIHPQTWRALGSLHFLNPSRKHLDQPLLMIPAEIILNLGLNPQVLNPVTGMLEFNLQGDRLYFTRFKDVFSEGRGSKFYLAQTAMPSWIDFNGNLSLKFRMRKYHLFFKLVDFFTVSIEGNIKKPSYTLQKQSKASHKKYTLPIFKEEN